MILLDTSFLISYYNKEDINNSIATKLMKQIDSEKYGIPMISDYIFDEVITVALLKVKRIKSKEIGNILLKGTKIIKVTDYIFQEAWEIFQKLEGFSFTDCTNIAIIQIFGIKNIATFDKEFLKINEINIINK